MELVLLLLLGLVSRSSSAARAVTHEDIRDAMINFVHLIRDSTEKLERHENRERQLGDHLRKALAGLDMRERSKDALLRNIGKTLNSIDERLKNLEAARKNQEEAAKSVYTVDSAPLQSWMTQVETLLSKQTDQDVTQSHNQVKIASLESLFNSKSDYLVQLVEKLQEEMALSAKHLNLLVAQQREQSNGEEKHNADLTWRNDVSKVLELQTNYLLDVRNKPQTVQQDNTTLDEVLALRSEILSKLNEGSTKTESKLQEILYAVNNNEMKILNSITDSNYDISEFYTKLKLKAEEILAELKAVQKVEQILIQTSDNVMDTKRRIEYGLHQMLQEIGEVVKYQGNELNNTVNNKFTGIADSIYTFQSGAVGNLSTKVETEIGQVWRQIGIMHQQITTSASVLDKLENETEVFIEKNENRMDAMATKLDNIGSDLLQIQDNHNFLIGRLSLFTHEFNETRSALADASKHIREAYSEAAKNAKQNEGPGPIYLDSKQDTSLDDNQV